MNRRALQAVLVLMLSVAGGCDIGGYDLPFYQCPLPGCDNYERECCQTVPCRNAAPCVIGPMVAPESAPAESRPDPLVAIRSTDRVTQERAIDDLARQGPSVLQEVELLLTDPDPRMKYAALQVLVRLRADAAPSVYDVKFLLGHCDPGIRAEAATVIGYIGCAAAEAVPELVCALDDPSAVVRYRVAVAFQNIGSPGESARAALERHAHCDRDPRVREAAACALYRLDQANCRQNECIR
jgi:HEAT repeats